MVFSVETMKVDRRKVSSFIEMNFICSAGNKWVDGQNWEKTNGIIQKY